MYLETPEIKLQPPGSAPTNPHWLKRMGMAGFAFFFLKGMLWLLIPWLAHSAMF